MLDDLRHLAAAGFAAVPPDRFDDLAHWCWDWCEASGDARYCSIARTLALVSAWWSEYEAVPTRLCGEIEQELVRWLGDVLDSQDAASGAMAGRALRQRVIALLLPPQCWDAYLER